jgi:anti-anti-sigma factor
MPDEVYRIVEERAVGVVEFRLRPDTDSLAMDDILEAIAAEMVTRALAAWVVDLSQVSYLNSAGLGLLCNIRFKVKELRAKLALCGLSPRLMELFRSCCLERLFVIAKTRQQAMEVVLR